MNKLGVESIISNICGKNKDMNSHLFSADMKTGGRHSCRLFTVVTVTSVWNKSGIRG